jgi:hypothetical protein
MPIANVNDCDIYFELNGKGPDLVFIHGEDHGIEMFEHQVAHFSAQYRSLTYYRRGHARSQLTPYGYSMRNQMLDLAGLLTQLRKMDVVEQDGIQALRITPEAGTVKGGMMRVVPLHQHLIAQSFLQFAEEHRNGPLFLQGHTAAAVHDPMKRK